jgi:CBS domain containing-hemolysin-like protein
MLPLADVERLPRDAPMGELVTRRLAIGERLIPIYDTSPAHITGIVRLESWDLLDPGIANRPTEDYCGPLKSVPRTMPVSEIIETLHANSDLTILVVDDANAGLGIIPSRFWCAVRCAATQAQSRASRTPDSGPSTRFSPPVEPVPTTLQ